MTKDRQPQAAAVYAELLARTTEQRRAAAEREAEGVAEALARLRADVMEPVSPALRDALISSAAQVIGALQDYGSPDLAGGRIDPAAVVAALDHICEARKRLAEAEVIALVVATHHGLGGQLS